MSEIILGGSCATVCAGVVIWLRHPWSRAQFWEAVENWGADNKEAAMVRDRRRYARRNAIVPRSDSAYVTHSDNGRVFEVATKGGGA